MLLELRVGEKQRQDSLCGQRSVSTSLVHAGNTLASGGLGGVGDGSVVATSLGHNRKLCRAPSC